MSNFRISGLSAEPFVHLYGLGDAELAARGAKRYVVDRTPGFPDRIEMRDLEVGEVAILVNFEHLPTSSPYRSSHAIFVREGATATYERVNEIPAVMRTRLLSLRAFDGDDMMVDCDVVDGNDLEAAIQRFLARPEVSYLHVHNAKPGCFSGRVDRV
jgi:Protein of unknown function (DUF1203)